MIDRAVVLVGTETRNAEDLAGELAVTLEGAGIETEVVDMEDAYPGLLNGSRAVVVCTATTGLGELPENSIDFFEALGEEWPDLEGVMFAVCGLGDSVFPDFCEAGRDDVVIGAFLAENNERSTSGSAYVVFGQENNSNLDLANLGDRGFRIDGATPADRAGISVDGAGDVNGDGLADVVVGADQSPPTNRGPGAAFVVFGKAGHQQRGLVDLQRPHQQRQRLPYRRGGSGRRHRLLRRRRRRHQP